MRDVTNEFTKKDLLASMVKYCLI